MNIKIIFFVTLTVIVFTVTGCGKKTIETKPVRKDVTETVFASGILEAEGTYQLTAKTDGYLQQVNFKEGDEIKVGMVMAVIDNKENLFNTQSAAQLLTISESNTRPSAPALQQAKQAMITAGQKQSFDSTQLVRYQRLWDANSIAKADLDNIVLQYNNSVSNFKTAEENYKLLQQQAKQQLISNQTQKQVTEVLAASNQIKALAAGKVFKKYKEKGDFVKKGDVIAEIGNAAMVYAKVNIDESNIGRIKLSQEALVSLNINKEKVYKATVAELLPAFDEATQSFICKLTFTDSLDFTIVGTQLQCNIIVATHTNALLIPRSFIDFTGHVTVKGSKTPQKIETGFVSNQWVQVLKGINENDVLLTDNLPENNIETSEAGAQIMK